MSGRRGGAAGGVLVMVIPSSNRIRIVAYAGTGDLHHFCLAEARVEVRNIAGHVRLAALHATRAEAVQVVITEEVVVSILHFCYPTLSFNKGGG
ncbi:hypothetical protein E2C01_047498 [Portunus trituberculatus]|uniref:Uncharacterized protein n=1 Tax=Portunus trituberculatus TaxID=210409 RepID=A0A5B7G7Q6_PORTR|nr:hypothetical protein [Portunus trituberculatus]